MTDIKVNALGNSGTWGEFYTNLELLSLHFANGFFDKYDLARAVVFKIDTDTTTALNKSMVAATTHVSKRGNVHRVNNWQVGLGLVDNYATATDEQASEGGHDDLFITPSGYTLLAGKIFGDFEDKVHHQGINPISSYGDMTFLPPDVYGSFEGSVAGLGYDSSCMLMEDDGTLTGLRFGTTGTTSGVYYFYKPNAEYSIGNEPPIRSNYKYYPSGIPDGLLMGTPYPCCSEGVLLINLLRPQDNPASVDTILSLTNGTLDQTKHYSTAISMFSGSGILSKNYVNDAMCGFIHNGYVYIVTGPGNNISWDVEYTYTVSRVKISDIKTKDISPVERVTGWTSIGFNDVKYIGDNIKMAEMNVSHNQKDNSAVYLELTKEDGTLGTAYGPSRVNRFQGFTHPKKSNLVRIAYNTAFYATNIYGNGSHLYYTLYTEIDLDAKTSKLFGETNKISVTWPDKSKGLVTSVPNPTNAIKTVGYGRHDWGPYLVSNNGFIFAKAMGNEPESSPEYYRARILNFSTVYDSLPTVNRKVIPDLRLPDPMSLGSAMSTVPAGPVIFNNKIMTFFQAGMVGNYPISDASICRTKLVGTHDGFIYTSYKGGSRRGYAPTVQRKFIKEAPSKRYSSDVSSDYNYRVHGVVLMTNSGSTVYDTIDDEFVSSGVVSYNHKELSALTLAAAKEVVGDREIHTYEGGLHLSRNQKFPPILTACVIVKSLTAGYDAFTFISEVDYTGPRSGNISGYKHSRVIKSVYETNRRGSVNYHDAVSADLVTFETKSGDILFGVRGTYSAATYGGSNGYVFCGVVPKNTNKIDISSILVKEGGYFRRQSLWSPVVVPDVGLCLVDGGINSEFSFCALGCRVLGDNTDDYKSRRRFNEIIILAAQQVEQGWLVYFTSESPLFMMGSEFTLPQTHIDLRDVANDPRNKTFHLYCRLKDQKAEYYITTEEHNPTMSLMYIGDIITDDTQIKTINVDKRIRLDTFQISPSRAGSGIPVTTGVPSQVGSFAWK
ncbi:putative membrane protein [Proteus phage 10]|nr:putative membrane protein [Proteus phage 10]